MFSIRIRIMLIIISIVFVITVSSLALGIFFSQGRYWDSVRDDLRASGIIAAEMVSAKLEVLKRDVRIIGTEIAFAGPADTAERLRYYTEHYTDTGSYLSLAVFDSEGWVDYYDQAAPSRRYLESEYMKRVQAGETFISPPEREPGGTLALHVWTPLRDGRFLVATMPGLTVSRMVSEFRIWETGNIFIIDRDGYVIANIRERWVNERFNFYLMGKEDPRHQSPGRLVEKMMGGGSGISYFNLNGSERICVYHPVAGFDGWSLGLVAPVSESPVSQIRQVLFLSSAAFLGLGIIAAFFAARNVAVPYQKIEEQNIRLEELRAAAESASEAKSRFLVNMSHEIRTPLNAIIGLAELELNSGELPEESYRSAEKIHRSGTSLLGIINDLLDVSKIETGRFELVPVEYSIPRLINDTVNLNIVRIGSKPVDRTRLDAVVKNFFPSFVPLAGGASAGVMFAG
jgi:hypothetical protein